MWDYGALKGRINRDRTGKMPEKENWARQKRDHRGREKVGQPGHPKEKGRKFNFP